MAFYTILFSPCGRTRRIAEILEREWKEEQRILSLIHIYREFMLFLR